MYSPAASRLDHYKRNGLNRSGPAKAIAAKPARTATADGGWTTRTHHRPRIFCQGRFVVRLRSPPALAPGAPPAALRRSVQPTRFQRGD